MESILSSLLQLVSPNLWIQFSYQPVLFVCIIYVHYICVEACMSTCMYEYMYVWVYVCMYVCMYITYAYKHVWKYVCMSTCMHVCMYVWTFVCMNVCIYERMHVWTYVCMNVCMNVCMYERICMYWYMYFSHLIYQIPRDKNVVLMVVVVFQSNTQIFSEISLWNSIDLIAISKFRSCLQAV